jgi:hypothetical protein
MHLFSYNPINRGWDLVFYDWETLEILPEKIGSAKVGFTKFCTLHDLTNLVTHSLFRVKFNSSGRASIENKRIDLEELINKWREGEEKILMERGVIATATKEILNTKKDLCRIGVHSIFERISGRFHPITQEYGNWVWAVCSCGVVVEEPQLYNI